MIYLTKDLLKNGETEYSIRNRIANGSLFNIGHGLYSDEPNTFMNEAFISKKYPNAIITGLSAFHLYNLTDVIPNNIYVATEQHSFPIRKSDIKQSYQDQSFFEIGKALLETDEGTIQTYDLERLLIETIRLKEKYPPELYYEVISNFRKIRDKLDFYKINNYVKNFKNGNKLLNKIKELI